MYQIEKTNTILLTSHYVESEKQKTKKKTGIRKQNENRQRRKGSLTDETGVGE